MSRILQKLRLSIDAAKGIANLASQGHDWRCAAAAVGEKLAGKMPLTWTVSMLRHDPTATLRVLYRPPKLPSPLATAAALAIVPAATATQSEQGNGKEASACAQTSAAATTLASASAAAPSAPAPLSAEAVQITLNSVTNVQQYLNTSNQGMAKSAPKTPSGREFLDIEGMLYSEVAVRTQAAIKTARVSAHITLDDGVIDDGVIDDAIACLGMLQRRKSEYAAQLQEALDWQAVLLQHNSHLKQATQSSTPTNYVMPLAPQHQPLAATDANKSTAARAHKSQRLAVPPFRTLVRKGSPCVVKRYEMDKSALPGRVALGSFRRAARALDRVHKEAHTGEASNQRWTRLKRSSTPQPCFKRGAKGGGGREGGARWKPRFGRTWWEDDVRERTLPDAPVLGAQAGVLTRLAHPANNTHAQDTDTDSDNEVPLESTAEEDKDMQQDKQQDKHLVNGVSLPKLPREYVGQRVERCSLNASGRALASATATVVAYYTAQESGVVSEKTGERVAVWRIQFHDDALGSEDLEEDELVDGYLAYRGVSSQTVLQRDALELEPAWQVSGSPLIGQQVRRGINDRHSVRAKPDSLAGFVDGTIRAWLPPERSNYFGSNYSGNHSTVPLPLFRVVYHSKEIGVEDLNLEEVQQAMKAYTPSNVAHRGDEWLAHGNSYIGKRIRRSVLNGTGTSMSAVDGMVRGWLPAELSNFWSDETRRPAALWRVVYDNLAIGQVSYMLLENSFE